MIRLNLTLALTLTLTLPSVEDLVARLALCIGAAAHEDRPPQASADSPLLIGEALPPLGEDLVRVRVRVS